MGDDVEVVEVWHGDDREILMGREAQRALVNQTVESCIVAVQLQAEWAGEKTVARIVEELRAMKFA